MKVPRKHAVVGLLMCIAALTQLGQGACQTTGKPKSFVRTFDDSSNWRIVEIKPESQGAENTWRTIVDTVAEKYDLEVIEKESGYLRSAWKYTYVKHGAISENYRSRVVIKLDEKVLQAKVKVESHWLSSAGWELGYDTVLLEDIYSDIQGKIGRIVR
jgi:hypothetical protein